MLRLRAPLLVFALVALLFSAAAPASAVPSGSAPLSLRLMQSMDRPAAALHAWVYFTDKALSAPGARAAALNRAEQALPAHTLWRRSKATTGPVVGERDVPVAESYLAQVLTTGARRRETSRWLNAVSVEATPAQLRAIVRLACVARLDVVESYRRNEDPLGGPDVPANGWAPSAADLSRAPSAPAQPALLDSTQYGVTWKQLRLHHIPELHDAGYHGEGVLICMLDSGFHLTHDAFNYPGHALQVAHSRDFIFGDTIVTNQTGQDQSGQDDHGTYTLSLIGGYYPGRFLGAAYNARFILGKTEWVPSESPIEEDHWMAGMEWADSLGADLISSSLGYTSYDTTTLSAAQVYRQMDGQTHVSTIAANMAESLGIVVVTAMGNEGAYGYPANKVSAPADGFHVVSVGATDSVGARASYSSTGPTWDRRLKPDVMTRGSRDWVVSRSSDQGYYGTGSGTSFSTPITAGAVALILQKNPGYNPLRVLDALHQTASHPSAPDTITGYGLLNAYAAATFVSTGVDTGGGVRNQPGLSLALSQNRPNPFRSGTVVDYSVSGVTGSQPVRVRVLDPSGRVVATLKDGDAAPGTHQAAWDGTWTGGRPAVSGVYFCRLESGGTAVTRRMVLMR